MLSDMGHQSILSGPTASAGWKSVRKGVMPAFSPQNIRLAAQQICLCLQVLTAELLQALSADCLQAASQALQAVA